MPEMQFDIRWPDEATSSCYSPSLVIKDFLKVGESYSVTDFMDRCRKALQIASERVRQKYGMHCTGALGQLEALEHESARFSGNPAAVVTVLRFSE